MKHIVIPLIYKNNLVTKRTIIKLIFLIFLANYSLVYFWNIVYQFYEKDKNDFKTIVNCTKCVDDIE